MDNKDFLLELLRKAQLRPSRPRVVVLQVLHAADDQALAAEDVFRRLLQRGTPVSGGTVYRVLHELEHADLVLREWNKDRKSLFRITPPDDSATPAVSVLCLDTGRRIVLEEPELYRQLVEAMHRHGVDLRGRALAIQCARPRRQHTPEVAADRPEWADLAAAA
ncbi:MAG: transcriptional repressor [Acidovorax sp.]